MKKKKQHRESTYCHICNKRFCNTHCHYTGKWRGAAHSICNLRYKVPKEIPVVFHNGSK